MANTPVSGFTAKTTPSTTDLLYLVQSPYGTGDDRKMTFANLEAGLTIANEVGYSLLGLKAGTLAQFAATTSAQLAGIISDETGSGALVFATSPTLVTPLLGTPTSGVLTNCTGYTDANLSVSDITTNDVSITKHGFAPKAPNDATKFLDGTGAWTVPPASLVNPMTTGGDIIYGGASGVPTRLANGSNGQVLTSSGGTSAPTWTSVAGTGTVTSVSVVTANGVSGSVATATTTPAITLTLGAITPTSVNGLTISTTTGTLTMTNGKTLAVTNTLTLSGTDSTTMTFPTTSASIARTDAGQTFTGVQVMTSPDLTTPLLKGSTITSNQNIAAVPTSDHTANGPTTSIFNLGATVALMDLVYLGSSSKWLLTDADAAATATGMLGICLDGGVDTDPTTVALSGAFVRDDSWNWTPGAPLYIDTATPGGLTATQPSGTDDVIRLVGYAVTADVIWFNPDNSWITHV